MWHDTGTSAWVMPAGLSVQPFAHIESAEGKRRIKNLVEVSGLLDHLVLLKPRAATEEEVLRLHTPEYVARIKRESDALGGDAGDLTPFGHGSYEIALLAAGGCITAVDAVLDGRVDNVYALVRPPGHHAERDSGKGFCIFANIAIAVQHARVARGLSRVAVVDWDVHHGNGTEDAFYSDPSVLTISIHADELYPPGRGGVEHVGAGLGQGANVNVPLPDGSGHGAYIAALETVVMPAVRRFEPELVIVASGVDASAWDPLGRQLLHSESYRQMTRLVMNAASECCDGRLVVIHEGGYSEAYAPFCCVAILECLLGVHMVEDPFLHYFADRPGQAIQPHQSDAIDRAAALLDR